MTSSAGQLTVMLGCMLLAPSAAFKPGQSRSVVDERAAPKMRDSREGQAFRPGYHIIADDGWMNDPVGMFEYNNMTHIFYQWNPGSYVWGAPHWGHAVSSDLVYWKGLPAVLSPRTAYDEDGVFSGSAAFGEDGGPVLYYTGVSSARRLGYFYQQTATAVPEDREDPELRLWVRSPANPLKLELPKGGTHAQFRDPLTPIRKHGKHWMALGGAIDCVGSAILYSSPDTLNWTLAGILANQMTAETTPGHCPKAATKNPDGTWCQPFGEGCQAWECPDLFELNDHIYVLKWSNQKNNRMPFAADWYLLSDVSPHYESASANSTEGVFSASLQGKSTSPREIDYGSVYASKSWKASDGRRLWVGWVYETAQGCYQQCTTGSSFIKSMGMLTLVREVTYDAESASLLFNPIQEISLLRKDLLYSGDKIFVQSASLVQASQIVSSPSLVQAQLLASFQIAQAESLAQSSFAVGAVLSMSDAKEVVVYVNGTLIGTSVAEARIYVDRSKAGRYTNTTLEGGPILLPSGGLLASELVLNVFLDHSLIEVFALGGRGRISSRVYAEDILRPKWELSLFGATAGGERVAVAAQVWSMRDCWLKDPETSI